MEDCVRSDRRLNLKREEYQPVENNVLNHNGWDANVAARQ